MKNEISKNTSRTGAHSHRRESGFELQPRDIEVCLCVHDLRVLTSDHISALFFPTESGKVSTHCRTRLRLLSRAGYLERREQPQTRAEGRKPYIYFLAERGRRLLIEELGYQSEDIHWQPGYNSVRWLFLEHQLMLNSIHVSFRLALDRSPWNLAEWTDDRILKIRHSESVAIVDEHGQLHETTVVPDAYMSLRVEGDHGLYFWIEADRATMTVQSSSLQKRSWARKIRSYQAYVQSQPFARLYPTTRIRVLSVTTTAERLDNLKAATESVGGQNRYWFTTYDQLRPETALDGPIWHIAGRDGVHALRQPSLSSGATR